jgi:hypothetical protein
MVQTSGPEHETLLDVENSPYTAVLQQDYETFERLCHPHLTYGPTAGNCDSLETYLAKIRSGELQYHRIDHSVESVSHLPLGRPASRVTFVTVSMSSPPGDIVVDGAADGRPIAPLCRSSGGALKNSGKLRFAVHRF